MSDERSARRVVDRRSFVKGSLIPLALPGGAAESASTLANDENDDEFDSAAPGIVDTNVHLFQWPFRRRKYGRTPRLIAKLRRHRITQAWAGSFEAVLQKRLDMVNRRLSEECRTRGEGLLIPIGSVNPAWPDWKEDLRRCHERYGMPGVRLYPAYHGYGLDHPGFAELLEAAASRSLLVQIVLRMVDERIHHPATDVAQVSAAALAGILQQVPGAKVQLINSAGPLLGNDARDLVQQTQVTFDIAACEGNGGVGRLIEGTNPSYRCAIPVQRLLFGSHAPYFPCESAVMKLFESRLSREQLELLMHGNARQLMNSNKVDHR